MQDVCERTQDLCAQAERPAKADGKPVEANVVYRPPGNSAAAKGLPPTIYNSVPASFIPRLDHAPQSSLNDRVTVRGKFFRLANEFWYLKGFTYGPFAPNGCGDFLPEPQRLSADLAHLRKLGANAIRLYHVPPRSLLDEALEQGLRVLIDIPWQKHRCFLEDWSAQQEARQRVEQVARELGDHPAVLALSVANEIPHDVVRFHGTRRVEKFVEELVDSTRQISPQCLLTYANYPSTEFFCPQGLDFYTANVYLDVPEKLGAYLDRLGHVAGNLPLILGEYGLDSYRHGEQVQADALISHVRAVFLKGLAGSFVFSYTDDWFTGGHQIENWAFGVTDNRRKEKPAAAELSRLWARVPCVRTPQDQPLPKASVVVCSYNGAATLEECLTSLQNLDYPDYEVILVDDGSTDRTPEIAKRFPGVRYLPQENLGLSAARNAGAQAAQGQIVAYTDSDCVAEGNWLRLLVQAMLDQGVAAIGGPNIPPASAEGFASADGWMAKCVAASPGGPSHVMLDDRHAEHVPGCNMAFWRDQLLALGGFDEQFCQAGDDVDICWRYLDAGLRIGYAPAALVWHHRRSTFRAYLKQQKGYGRSEAMVVLKHPWRANALGAARWAGVIYGEGSVGLPTTPQPVYHGRFGTGPFQIIYRHNQYGRWAYFSLFEWHALALLILAFAWAWHPIAWVTAGMEAIALGAALQTALVAPLPRTAPFWCRFIVFIMHFWQPVIRGFHRHLHQLLHRRLPAADTPMTSESERSPELYAKHSSAWESSLFFTSDNGKGREELLESLEQCAAQARWTGDFRAEFEPHDLELTGDWFHSVRVRTATEELGWPRRFTRACCGLKLTGLAKFSSLLAAVWIAVALLSRQHWAEWVGVGFCIALVGGLFISRRRCQRAIWRLILRAGVATGLEPVTLASLEPADKPKPASRDTAGSDPLEDAEVCVE